MEWIYRRDRLPDKEMTVIAVLEYSSHDAAEILRFSPDRVQWKWWSIAHKKWYRHRKVIWWMPLPEIPKDDDE